MEKLQRDVKAFHDKFGSYSQASPALPSPEIVALRKRLIEEEIVETFVAMERGDIAEVADGIADSIYVLLGTALAYGIDMEPIWDAVQDSNMKKVGGQTRGDGKILKPAGWVRPDVNALISQQIGKAVIEHFRAAHLRQADGYAA